MCGILQYSRGLRRAWGPQDSNILQESNISIKYFIMFHNTSDGDRCQTNPHWHWFASCHSCAAINAINAIYSIFISHPDVGGSGRQRVKYREVIGKMEKVTRVWQQWNLVRDSCLFVYVCFCFVDEHSCSGASLHMPDVLPPTVV